MIYVNSCEFNTKKISNYDGEMYDIALIPQLF